MHPLVSELLLCTLKEAVSIEAPPSFIPRFFWAQHRSSVLLDTVQILSCPVHSTVLSPSGHIAEEDRALYTQPSLGRPRSALACPQGIFL